MKVMLNTINNGTTVKLTGDRTAIVRDGMKNSMTRLVEVIAGGFCRETGSEYVFNILQVQVDGAWYEVEMTDRQKKRAAGIKDALDKYF